MVLRFEGIPNEPKVVELSENSKTNNQNPYVVILTMNNTNNTDFERKLLMMFMVLGIIAMLSIIYFASKK